MLGPRHLIIFGFLRISCIRGANVAMRAFSIISRTSSSSFEAVTSIEWARCHIYSSMDWVHGGRDASVLVVDLGDRSI